MSKEIDINKTSASKECEIFFTIGVFQIKGLIFSQMYAMAVMLH